MRERFKELIREAVSHRNEFPKGEFLSSLVDFLIEKGASISPYSEEASKTLKRAIEVFGEEAQENMCIEECAELIQAINKKHRHEPHNIPEEIADVEIMIEQLKIINGCHEEVGRIREEKLQKLILKLRKEEERMKCKYSTKIPEGYGCRCGRNGMIRKNIYFCPFFKPSLWTRIKSWF